MNERLTMPRLAALLAAKTGLPQKTCEDYLRQIITTVSEALAKGENVRISGLGTFKLVHVEPRRSVDVNTGEPVVLPARRKVVFVPSKEMASLANAPFAMFEAVELAEGVTEAELDSLEQAPTVSADISEPSETILNDDPGMFSYELSDDDNTDVAGIEPAAEEASGPGQHLPVLYQGSYDDIARMKRRRFGYGFMAGFISAVALLGLLASWVWYDGRCADPTCEYRDNTVQVVPADTVAADTVASMTFDTAVAAAEVPQIDTQPSDAPAKKVYDYVSTTRYLTTIAKEHYGNYNLWPYIYEENKAFLGHPDRIRPGTRVVVPPLSKYGVNPGDPAAIAEAKRLGVAIYARYK